MTNLSFQPFLPIRFHRLCYSSATFISPRYLMASKDETAHVATLQAATPSTPLKPRNLGRESTGLKPTTPAVTAQNGSLTVPAPRSNRTHTAAPTTIPKDVGANDGYLGATMRMGTTVATALVTTVGNAADFVAENSPWRPLGPTTPVPSLVDGIRSTPIYGTAIVGVSSTHDGHEAIPSIVEALKTTAVVGTAPIEHGVLDRQHLPLNQTAKTKATPNKTIPVADDVTGQPAVSAPKPKAERA
ncbi:hypothetical protein B0T26DRAFT_700845 [Lasiosphaeria miniovina]|uniref:Uncharacterized protein n=1 Tax=Lasiosphaeria miniovina TaxID=1954250 RepID=A0AA40DZZ8_9PEZI|nr:uncharacterized protein B0T26DRAFT_700845 [Lasiosphaeria miniovina]KAK0721970.1 hypothetical protein B0T26DRAFT_700845 [Lasiosphaeria miniovina]